MNTEQIMALAEEYAGDSSYVLAAQIALQAAIEALVQERDELSRQSDKPAFPVSENNGSNSGWPGMTMRDYFAAKAMASQLLHPRVQGGEGTNLDIAISSYLMADAMLIARSKS